MKKKIFYFLSFFSLLLFSQCGPTVQDAIDYNENIIEDQLIVIDEINSVDSVFTTYNPEEIDAEISNAKKKVANAISNLKRLGVLNEDSSFYNGTMELYKLFESQLNNEYAEQLEIYKLSEDDYTEEKRLRYNELLNKINNDYGVVNKKFILGQKSFAESWGLEIEGE